MEHSEADFNKLIMMLSCLSFYICYLVQNNLKLRETSIKPFRKEHGFEFKNEKLYIHTMADERDAICNMKALKTLSPR